MNDIVDRLRTGAETRRVLRDAINPQMYTPHIDLMDEAANEIERLRLTAAERESIDVAVEYVGSAYAVERHAEVLRDLLERTK